MITKKIRTASVRQCVPIPEPESDAGSRLHAATRWSTFKLTIHRDWQAAVFCGSRR